MDLKRAGLVIGGIFGFFLGASLSSRGGVSLVGKVTGGVIVEDLKGAGFGVLYALVGAVFMAVAVAAVFMSIEEIKNLIVRRG